MLEAELESPSLLEPMLAAQIPADWPPGEYDRGAIEFLLAQLTASWPQKDGWLAWYAIKNADDVYPAVLVGAGGYYGPPDAHHRVEIGFSISQVWQGNGYATEMAGALLWRAAQSGLVQHVIAHTLPVNQASMRVLQKCGFVPTAPDEPDLLAFEYAVSPE